MLEPRCTPVRKHTAYWDQDDQARHLHYRGGKMIIQTFFSFFYQHAACHFSPLEKYLAGTRAPNKVIPTGPCVSDRAGVLAIGVEDNTVSAGRACKALFR